MSKVKMGEIPREEWWPEEVGEPKTPAQALEGVSLKVVKGADLQVKRGEGAMVFTTDRVEFDGDYGMYATMEVTTHLEVMHRGLWEGFNIYPVREGGVAWCAEERTEEEKKVADHLLEQLRLMVANLRPTRTELREDPQSLLDLSTALTELVGQQVRVRAGSAPHLRYFDVDGDTILVQDDREVQSRPAAYWADKLMTKLTEKEEEDGE